MMELGKKRARLFAVRYLQTMDAEVAAAAVGRTDGTALLEQKEVSRQVQRSREALQEQFRPADTVRRLSQMAFGRANDCVKLVLEQSPALDELDLTLLQELKRSDKGAIEVKLVDRVRVLDRLLELAGSGAEQRATEFLEALRDQEEAEE